jgi:hypothetical protein
VFDPFCVTEIIFDFDNPVLDFARVDAVKFVESLRVNHEVDLRNLMIYFSGAKGFHVVMPASLFHDGPIIEDVSIATIRGFTRQLASGIVSFDKDVYNARRIFRIPGAVHNVTGLRKTLISPQTLMYKSADEIKDMAQNNDPNDIFELYEMPETKNELLAKEFINAHAIATPSTSIRESNSIRDIFAPANPGKRNQAATRIVGLLKSKSVDIDLAWIILLTWNRGNTHKLEEDELHHILTGIYKRYTK